MKNNKNERKIAVGSMVVALSLLVGSDQNKALAFVKKDKKRQPKKMIIDNQVQLRTRSNPLYQSKQKLTKKLLSKDYFATLLNGGDDCAVARTVTQQPFNDTGDTTGANNTVNNYNSAVLAFLYPGPDVYYRIVLNSAGTISASMDLTGSTLDGVLFLTDVCPAGTGNTIPVGNTLGNSQDQIGGGAGPELLPVTAVPAGTYFIGVDSYYGGGAISAGPYAINIVVSPFTSADATINGRVLTSSGQGIGRVNILITDSEGEERYFTTNPFGYFNIDELEAGSIYVIQVLDNKQYQFSNNSQVITVQDDITNLTFTADN